MMKASVEPSNDVLANFNEGMEWIRRNFSMRKFKNEASRQAALVDFIVAESLNAAVQSNEELSTATARISRVYANESKLQVISAQSVVDGVSGIVVALVFPDENQKLQSQCEFWIPAPLASSLKTE
jgi:hypothetical protein